MPRASVALLTVVLFQAPAVDIRVAARSMQPGELVLLTIAASAPAAVHVRAFDRDWPAFTLDNQTWTALVGIDVATAPGDYEATVRIDTGAGVRRGIAALKVADKTFATRTLTVDDAFVNPPASAQARIAREAKELAEAWRTFEKAPRWHGAFVPPVPQQATSAFGARSVFNGQPRGQHGGADFPSPAGTPVHAPAAGRVLLVGDFYYTGRTVMIDHGVGLISLFAHLSAIGTTKGADVNAGDVIGNVGATGRVTGAHLHWTIRTSGVGVDPLSVLHALGAG